MWWLRGTWAGRCLSEWACEVGGGAGALTASNLEWSMGYGPRFGVTMVDRENGFKRTPKDSALYLAKAFRHLKGV